MSIRRSSTIVFLFGLSGLIAFAQVSGGDKSLSDSTERRAKYAELSRKVFATHEQNNGKEVEQSWPDHRKIVAQLHHLVSAQIVSTLSIQNATTADVKKAIAEVQGDLSLGGPDANSVPYCQKFSANGIQTVAVAYAVLYGGDAISDTDAYLEFYDKRTRIEICRRFSSRPVPHCRIT